MPYLFTSEFVSEGHPDKVADQISDALVDEFLRVDPESKVACETLVTTGLVVLSGEVKTRGYVDVQQVARNVIGDIGYTKGEYMFESLSCGVLSAIHEQSPDINQGVERVREEDQGAGDQGMMFGYACRDTDEYMPLALVLSRRLLTALTAIRKEGKQMKYLRPDAKSQVTIEYEDNGQPKRVHTIVISTQHDDFDEEAKMLASIRRDVQEILIPRVINGLPERIQAFFDKNYILHVNPTGKFVIGGPHGDTGLTGRKIIVDTYGGYASHGGGAFSGKDPSKVDRSAAYMARYAAKNIVAAKLARLCQIEIAYAIGVARPVSILVDTKGTGAFSDERLGEIIIENFDFRPSRIIKTLDLRRPIYRPTAAYGHFGREDASFSWEKTDLAEKLRSYL